MRTALAFAGLTVLGLALYLSDGLLVLKGISEVDFGTGIVVMVGVCLSTVMGAFNVFRIADLATFVRFRSFLSIFWRSWALGITLPGQVADIPATIWQLRGGGNADLSFIAGRLIIDKIISLLCILSLALSLPLVLNIQLRLDRAIPVLGAIFILGTVILISGWLSRNSTLGRRFAATTRPLLSAAKLPAARAIENVFVSAMKLAVTGACYWWVLRAIAPEAPDYIATTVIALSASLISYIPISFNGIGTVEVSAIALFGEMGVVAPTVLSAYLVMRAITLFAAWAPVAWWSVRR